MRTPRTITILLPAITALTLTTTLLAGPLNPPAGPIAPTPGPEPRIPINATTTPGDADSVFRITESGSYYLTSNHTGQSGKALIEIANRNITIDLSGYTIFGVPGSLDGIRSPIAFGNITIRNGFIFAFGGAGVHLAVGAAATNILLSDLTAFANGQEGFVIGNAAIVTN